MSDYTPTAKPAFQSALSSKDIRDEFSAIATAINSKLDETGGALTATVAELNVLDGITATTAELNYCDGVTSAIQTQLDTKAPKANPTFTGTVFVESTVRASYGAGGDVSLSTDNNGPSVTLFGSTYGGSSSGDVVISSASAVGSVQLSVGGVVAIDVNSTDILLYKKIRKNTFDTAPASASDTGTLGEIRVTTDYIYVCVATNTWKRVALSTW